MDIQVVLGTFLVLTPVVVGLVAVFKPFINERLVPLASVLAGIILAWIGSTIIGGLGWAPIVLGGLVLGLSACGLYSGTKATVSA
jgi:hypothetical protein